MNDFLNIQLIDLSRIFHLTTCARFDIYRFNVYKFGIDQFVVVLNRTKADHHKIRNKLEKELTTLKGFGLKYNQISINVWSLEFKYSKLYQDLNLDLDMKL